jgi:thioredoxin 1
MCWIGKVAMNLDDLEIAERRLDEKGLTLCAIKEGQVIFEAKSRGVCSFVEAVERFKGELHGASIADRVVGKAIALLCVYVNVKGVYAATISKAAKALLEDNLLHIEWDTLVENILAADKSTTCPFEKLVDGIRDPSEAYRKLKDVCASQTRFGVAEMNKRSVEHERFISEENEELKRIREKKLAELKARNQMDDEPFHMTDANFEETVRKHSLAMIDFWAPWCGPCLALTPVIEELYKDYSGKMLIGKLNVDENSQTAERFKVFSIPTLLVMKNGQEVDRIVGCVPKRHIEAALKKHLGM